jgi:hypothetical protein
MFRNFSKFFKNSFKNSLKYNFKNVIKTGIKYNLGWQVYHNKITETEIKAKEPDYFYYYNAMKYELEQDYDDIKLAHYTKFIFEIAELKLKEGIVIPYIITNNYKYIDTTNIELYRFNKNNFTCGDDFADFHQFLDKYLITVPGSQFGENYSKLEVFTYREGEHIIVVLRNKY